MCGQFGAPFASITYRTRLSTNNSVAEGLTEVVSHVCQWPLRYFVH